MNIAVLVLGKGVMAEKIASKVIDFKGERLPLKGELVGLRLEEGQQEESLKVLDVCTYLEGITINGTMVHTKLILTKL